MTLDKKILIGFISCSLVLILVAVISFRNSEKFIETGVWVNHTHGVLYEIEHILLSSVDAEAGVRGYAISGNETFLESFAASRIAAISHLNEVRRLTADNPMQQKNIDLLEIALANRINNLEGCIQLGQRGSLDSARQFVASLQGKRFQDELNAQLSTIRSIEQKLLAERSQESQDDADRFNLLFVALMLAIGIVLLAGYLTITSNIRALRRAEKETNDKNWFLTGSSEITRRMQGNQSVTQLSQSALNAIVSFLNVPAGAMYVRERNGNQLKLEATYALDKSKVPQLVRLGEGIVGQAAADRKEILLHDVQSHSYDVSTTSGNLRPKCILATPLTFENNVVGVVELGSLDEFTPQQREFLNVVSDAIAISLVSSQAQQEAKDLLEETQRQAEELEAQQHELKQTNEELHAKTELLEKSEQILKTQQEELQQVNVELEEKANVLEEQKGKLEDAKNEIERKAQDLALSSKYKSEFLANMSHELRTPLNSILILSQLLTENKHQNLTTKEIEHAKNINSSGVDLLNLINEILDLSKIESGKLQLEITTFGLDEICSRLKDTFTEIGKSRSIEFAVTCDDPNTEINTDRQRIEQVLKNLLSNAFKFTPTGGRVSLAITSLDEQFLSISVTDTGIGIPPDKRQIIFEAFQQADGSTKRKYGGTGLGLSISRELATALGGKIYLESEEGQGSTFTLILPRKLNDVSPAPLQEKVDLKPKPLPKREIKISPPKEEQKTSAIDDRHDISGSDRVVLIIEDDEKFANTLLNFVRNRNYKGVIASDGTSGLSFARHYRPDAILLDMKLPVMDGYEVLNHLKTDPALRHIPVQIISGFDRQRESLALGAFDYLMKPVALPDLHRAFDKIEKFTSKQLKKLLIIEDNAQQNNAIRELIGNGDVKSFSAYSGEEAQELLRNELFDCIIVDLGLPDMSGFELLERIKANEELNTIPIIVYTGKDLKKEEAERLSKLSDTVVLKTANSHERLLDETSLFLHRVESKLPRDKQMMIRKLHKSDEVLKGKTILIVDDDIRNIYSLTSALDDEGITCVTAENGKVALSVLSSQDVDLVLMDVMMPEMDGYEATIEIRKIERLKKLPIIALTAKAMKGDKEKCLSVGMSDYISKPVNIEQLLSLMRVWLYKAQR